jgi:hypothetical protein
MQRHALAESGAPLPLLDDETGQAYILLSVDLSPAPMGGIRAESQGMDAVGEGDEPEDALWALAASVKALGS